MTSGSWADDLLDFFLPTGCVVCRTWIPAREIPPIVCVSCRTRLAEAPWPRCTRCHHPRGTGRVAPADCLECRDWPPELTAARYAYVLGHPADDLVHALKYEGWRELAGLMASSMAAAVADCVSRGSPTLVVPVPTTPERLKERGYNQAHLLAERLASLLDLPLRPVLARALAPRSQTALTPMQRRENVRGAFGPSPTGVCDVDGADILLVDDVLTTGATAAEAALTLTRAGAATVTVVAFARALPSRPRKVA